MNIYICDQQKEEESKKMMKHNPGFGLFIGFVDSKLKFFN